MDNTCINCGNKFRKRGKSYYRTALFSKLHYRNVTASPAAVLTEKFSVDVTPGKKAFICSTCENLLFLVHQDKENAKANFVAARKKGSYLSKKIKPPLSPHSRQSPASKCPRMYNTSTRTIPIKEGNIGKAIGKLANRSYKKGFHDLITSSREAKAGLKKVLCEIIREESNNIMKSKLFPSIQSIRDLDRFSIEKVQQEFHKKCPFLFTLLTAALTKKKGQKELVWKTKKKEKSIKTELCFIMAQILFTRNRSQNFLQCLNSILLWYAGCKRKVTFTFCITFTLKKPEVQGYNIYASTCSNQGI